MNIFIDSRINDDQWRAELYRGSLFTHSPTSGAQKLCQLAQEMVKEAFRPFDPLKIQESLPAEKCAEILAVLKPKFIHHAESKKYIQQMLSEAGCDLSRTYFDVPRMRTAFPGNYLKSGIAYAFHPHRDTWYSAPFCQINWWMPIYDTRVQPRPEEPVELDPQVRVVCDVAAAYQFSAAQLHSTVPNTSNVTRYSVDFRTVHLDDVLSRNGAPNVDSACTGTTMGDYLRGTDCSHLPKEAMAVYFDGTEIQYGKS
jgi:hypothetical protein